LAEKLKLEVVCCPCPEKEVSGVYIGDLLSWVMGRAQADNVWITIMSNINILAVASLADTACIVLAEGVEADEQILDGARARGINIIRTQLPAYEAAVTLSGLI
jgi:hypothetical protein